MAVFSDAEKIDVLIKSSFGVTSTDETLPWYLEVTEPFNQYTIGENILIDTIPSNPVFDTSRNPSDIGLSSSDFHSSNNDNDLATCSIVDDSTGTVRRFRYLLLDTTGGTNYPGRSWTKIDSNGNNVLHNSLAFNYKKVGTYAPYESKLYHTNDTSPIQIGPATGSWSYNTGTGILFFADYEEQDYLVSTSNPPAFLVYVYIGKRGLSNFAGGGGGGTVATGTNGALTVSGDIVGQEDLELNAGIIIQDDYLFDTSATRLFPDARFENLEVRDGLTVYGDISTNSFNVVKNVTFSGDITSDTLNTANIIQFDQTGTTLDVDLSGDVYRNSITTFGNIDAGGMIIANSDISANGMIIANGDISANGNLSVSGTITMGTLQLDNAEFGNIDASGNIIASGNIDVCGNIIASGNVGVGIDVPRQALDVSGTTIISGNVGIGTTSPTSNLHIHDSALPVIRLSRDDDSHNGLQIYSNSTAAYLSMKENLPMNFETNLTTRMTINSNGNVGIGTANPAYKLDLNGDLRIPQAYTANGESSRIWFTNNYAGNGFGNTSICYVGGPSGNEQNGSHLRFSTGGMTNALCIRKDGNVGIGTNNPNHSLHVYAPVSTDSIMKISSGSSTNGLLLQQGTNKWTYIRNTESDGGMIFHAGNAERIRINPGGQVGIGRASINGVVKLHVAAGSGTLGPTTNIAYFNTTTLTSKNGLNSCSILADDDIVSADAIGAYSDRRIKKNIVEINDASSLEKLRLLKPSYYEYIDPIKKNYDVVEGFIAQEVKDVLPYAVKQLSECIPNIFQKANCELDSSGNYIITLSDYDTANLEVDSSGNIYPGLKLYDPSDNEIDTTIKEVISSTQLKIESNKDIPSEVFVYGQEVDNFNYLQKERVFTVGISALQEVDRQQQADKARIASLETENATLKTQMADVLTRLAALESA